MVARLLLASVALPVTSLSCDVSMATSSPRDDVQDTSMGLRHRQQTSSETTAPEAENTDDDDSRETPPEQTGIIHNLMQQEWVRNAIVYRGDFVVDPQGDAVYLWMGVVAAAVLYNIWAVILRIAFSEMRQQLLPRIFFMLLDILADAIYVIDIALQFRMGYLEDGIMVHDPMKLALHYINERHLSFISDVTAAIPLPSTLLILAVVYSYEINGVCYPMSRLPKLIKFHSITSFITAMDMKTNSPNLHRACKLLVYLATTIHWIGCFYYIITEYEGIGSNEWVIQKSNDTDDLPFHRKYLRSIYWSTMTLTTIGATWGDPQTDIEYLFTGFTFLIGVFMFATVVGNVGDVISKMNAARADYQQKMDVIKIYMRHHNIPEVIQNRVKKWAEYTWNRTQAMDDQSMLNILPLRLRAEIATHVHLETLQKVRIFEECEKGLLCELVVRLRSQIYSPGDFICRKGEIGREMYIINHGKVEVVITNHLGECTVVATLTEGNYFGEISLLKLDDGCNRRNADVRSVGYSELLVLSKRDLMQSLVEYPEARRGLEKQARDRMKEFKDKMRAYVRICRLAEWNIRVRSGEPGQPMERIRAEQNLQVHNPEVYSNDTDDYDVARSALVTKKVKEREMSELRHVIKELKSFDSQAVCTQLRKLQEEVTSLKSEVKTRDRELVRLRRRLVRYESRDQNNDVADVKVTYNGAKVQLNGEVTYSTSDVDTSNHNFHNDNTSWNRSDDIFEDREYTHSPSYSHSVDSWVTEHAQNQQPDVTSEISYPVLVPGISINDIVDQEPHIVLLPSRRGVGRRSRRPSTAPLDLGLEEGEPGRSTQLRHSMTYSLNIAELPGDSLLLDDHSVIASDDDSFQDESDLSDSDF